MVHTPHGHVFHGYFGTMKSALFANIERMAARWSDRIVTLTRLGANEHLEHRIGRPEQYTVIPSGVPVDRFRVGPEERMAARQLYGFADDQVVIGSLGRLVPVKGHTHLLEAVASLVEILPSIRLLLAGEGELRPALEGRAGQEDLKGRVVFAGHLENPLPALAAADIFVLPSLNEGQGRAAVEAMAAGRPVIASDVGGLPEVLDFGRAGKLAGSEGRSDRLIRAGLRRAQQYDEATMIDRIDSMYRQLLGTRERMAS